MEKRSSAPAQRYLPAYSPDLNPIDQAFAKLKAALRKAAARKFDALIRTLLL
jgi:transposase